MEKICCIFEKPKEEFQARDSFTVLKKYEAISAPGECKRNLLKCNKCGALFLYQALDWNDDYYNDYIQVSSEEEADKLNEELATIFFSSSKHPMIKIGRDKKVLFKLPKDF